MLKNLRFYARNRHTGVGGRLSKEKNVLYDVWHHLIRKPAFASVHAKTLSARFQKTPLLGPFSKTCVFMPENTVQG